MNRFGVMVAIWLECECGCINRILYAHYIYSVIHQASTLLIIVLILKIFWYLKFLTDL